jgi:RNA polymerase sigma-70 factor (ECF subfamily)
VRDEADDVALARAGDGEAFMRLVTVYERRLRAYARGLAGDADLAEDIAQEAFLRAWRGLPGFRSGSFPAWLFGITRNTAKELRRRAGPAAVPLDAASALSDRRAPDLALRRDLDLALAALDGRLRDAFTLVALGGLPYQEAAAVLGCPAGTVASRVHRAREQLIRSLAVEEDG